MLTLHFSLPSWLYWLRDWLSQITRDKTLLICLDRWVHWIFLICVPSLCVILNATKITSVRVGIHWSAKSFKVDKFKVFRQHPINWTVSTIRSIHWFPIKFVFLRLLFSLALYLNSTSYVIYSNEALIHGAPSSIRKIKTFSRSLKSTSFSTRMSPLRVKSNFNPASPNSSKCSVMWWIKLLIPSMDPIVCESERSSRFWTVMRIVHWTRAFLKQSSIEPMNCWLS